MKPSFGKQVRRIAATGTSAAALLASAATVSAEAIEKATPDYWYAHSAITGGSLLLGAITGAIWDQPLTPRQYPPPDLWALSDAAYALDLILPLPALATGNDSNAFGHALFIYGEALAGGYLLNNVARVTEHGGTRGVIAFAAATVASHLFTETVSAPRGVVDAFWAVEFGLASASTVWRYRGTHPDQQSWVQALTESVAGAAFGTGMYELSHGDLQPFWRRHVWAALLGAGLGTVAGREVRSTDETPTLVTLDVVPSAAGAPGLTLIGTW